jgi:hypothetical protein
LVQSPVALHRFDAIEQEDKMKNAGISACRNVELQSAEHEKE